MIKTYRSNGGEVLNMDNEILTVKQAAEYLKLSVRSVHKLIADKKLLASQISVRSWRVKKSDIDSFLIENTNLVKGGYSDESSN
jgi:excisionase family DNA binding protein